MKIKTISRVEESYTRDCKGDRLQVHRNRDPSLHPFEKVWLCRTWLEGAPNIRHPSYCAAVAMAVARRTVEPSRLCVVALSGPELG